MSADVSENLVSASPYPQRRPRVGTCDWVKCGRAAYFSVDFDCDDETADLCTAHYDGVVALLTPFMPHLFNCEGDE